MKYLSVCSGIEAATVAWHYMGWEPVAFSEIEKFPSAVLAHHYPNVPNWGDMTKYKEWPDANIDVLVGGTPCQSFSVAGLRKGLDDPRGNLMLTYLAIAKRYRPEWLVWENVPGVLSSEGGRDFAALLRGLDELGYGWAYRVLDAQYFGVAQRRRRVFVVGHLGNWQRAAAVLFERHSLSGHPAPSRQARKGTAGGVARGAGSSGFRMTAFGEYADDGTASTMKMRDYKDATDLVAHTTESDDQRMPDKANAQLVLEPVGVTIHGTDGTTSVASYTDVSSSLRSRIPSGVENSTTTAVLQPVAFHHNAQACQLPTENRDTSVSDALTCSQQAAVAHPVTFAFDPGQSAQPKATHQFCIEHTAPLIKERVHAVASTTMQVRRLTPVECERLQGFPDGYTNIPWRGKPESPDGPRYKALGNSMAVPVMSWIGERINEVSKL